jgi:hypothetical protein
MTTHDELRYIAACFAAFGHNDCAVTLRDASRAWRYESFADEQSEWREVFARTAARFDALPGKVRRGSTRARCADLWRKAARATGA